MSKYRGVKTNNAPTNAKEIIRNFIFDNIESEKNVLEIFSGRGEMYKKVWHKADRYLGIDKVKCFDERNLICGDALKAVSTINLDDFNIFDIDSYGSPYEILSKILQRYNGKFKQIAFILTDGSAMDLKLGRISKGLREMTGINFHIAKTASNIHETLIKLVVKKVESELSGKVTHVRYARSKVKAAMRYYAFIIKANSCIN